MDSLVSSIKQLFLMPKHREIIYQLTKRDIEQKYKGSFLGIVWTIINPLLMLGIYTFVFSFIFKSKWGQGVTNNHLEFALSLFCGLIVFNIFSETVSRAPSIVASNSNFVKKVVFPLEILPVSAILAALFQSMISFSILLVFIVYSMNFFPVTILYLPIIILPLVFLTLGISWFLASLGVYIRDIGQTINIMINMLFYLTPIFYPVSSVPDFFKNYMLLNPLTNIIENVRNILLWEKNPDWNQMIYIYTISIVVFVLGLTWFNKTRKGFADVV